MNTKTTSSILVIDIGGTNVKVLGPRRDQVIKIPSGQTMTPSKMVKEVRHALGQTKYSHISIGYPGPVIAGRVVSEPHNLGQGWVGFDFEKAFGRPVKLINDAALQAVGSYEGGRMLFLGLGTGLGSALIVDGMIEPMELAHLPYKKGRTYEDYVGARGLERLGKKKWRRHVLRAVKQLGAAMQADYVVLGGGNARRMKELPPNVRLGQNSNAYVGGCRLWQDASEVSRAHTDSMSTSASVSGHRNSRSLPSKDHRVRDHLFRSG
ncbi:MAG TPA: ROK family protein [Candidatus Sulfotelmatobacter sp.]|nr:ROK family protein [Candidatus Sulfotelmatobacter sp.]